MKFNYTFYQNTKSNTGIIIDGCTFYSIKGTQSNYRNTVKNCKARGRLIDDTFVELQGEHEHERNAQTVVNNQKICSMIKNLSIHTNLTSSEIISKIKREVELDPELKIITTNKHLKRMIRNERKEVSLLGIEDHGIFLEYFYTIDEKKFIQYLDFSETNTKMLILFNESNLMHLQNSKTWVCDGTFFACPKEFKQIYVIHGEILGHYFPLIYFFFKHEIICYISKNVYTFI
jgi:hypothetical protein